MNCKHCHGRIARNGSGSWYHTLTEAQRCHDDASFIFAEPK